MKVKIIKYRYLLLFVCFFLFLIGVHTFTKKGYEMTKNDWYEFGEIVGTYSVNDSFQFENTILNHSKELFYQIDQPVLELEQYYFVDLKAYQLSTERNRVIVKMYTFKDGELLETFELGLNSNYNVVYLNEDYDQIKFELSVYGSTHINLQSIVVRPITSFKMVNCDSYHFNSEKNSVFQGIVSGVRHENFKILSDEEVMERLEQGIYVEEYYGELIQYTIDDLVDWENSSITSRQHLLQLSEFTATIYYIELHKRTSNPIIIDKYYEMIEAFIDHYPYVSQENGLIYNDLAVAGRVYSWLWFYDYAEPYLEKEQKDKLISSIVYQGNLLIESHFNAKGTNHGLYQDLVYLQFINVLCGEYDITGSRNRVVQNINEYFDSAVSENGVHLEHSPNYHILMMDSINQVLNIYHQLNIDSTILEVKEYKMNEFLSYITKPDGNIPELGDTNILLNPYQSKYSLNLDLNVVYPSEGYAIFRDSFDADGTYVLFYNAYHSYYHKHGDENGVWIYRDGDIIREAGRNGYDYTDPFTRYSYSYWGHNSLIVNNVAYLEEKNIPNDYNYSGTYIESYNIDNSDLVSVIGVNERYPNVVHKRTLEYDKRRDVVTVFDQVTSEENNQYSLLWQLGDSITPVIDGKSILLYRNDQYIMMIDIEADVDFDIQFVYGQEEPNILGWYSENTNNPKKTYTIKVDMEQKDNVSMTTKFIFQ